MRRYKGKKGKAWKLLSKFIRERDNQTCVTCGNSLEQGYQMQAGHFMPVGLVGSNNKLSWDERNIYCQCARCNGPGQGMQEAMARHIERVHGKAVLDDLIARVRKVDPVESWDDIIARYE